MSHVSRNSNGFNPFDYEVFIAADVDARKAVVTALTRDKEYKPFSTQSSGANLANYARKSFGDQRVIFAYEAGPTGLGLYDELRAEGFDCIVATPSMVPVAPGRQVKTNSLDSRSLVKSLRAGDLRAIRVPSFVYRELRDLVGLRKKLVEDRRATKSRIRAMLLNRGQGFPKPPGSKWTKAVIKDLRFLDCTPAVRLKLDMYLDDLDRLDASVKRVEGALRETLDQDEDAGKSFSFLLSLPGVGFVTAVVFLSRVGDWRSLGKAEETASFIGLTPRESSTGDVVWRGSVTKAGNGYLRSLLIEAAWVAIQKDMELKSFYVKVRQSHHSNHAAKIAIVAVARKLAMRMHSVMKDRRAYEVRKARLAHP